MWERTGLVARTVFKTAEASAMGLVGPYFYGDNGARIGASHQTGLTASFFIMALTAEQLRFR